MLVLGELGVEGASPTRLRLGGLAGHGVDQQRRHHEHEDGEAHFGRHRPAQHRQAGVAFARVTPRSGPGPGDSTTPGWREPSRPQPHPRPRLNPAATSMAPDHQHLDDEQPAVGGVEQGVVAADLAPALDDPADHDGEHRPERHLREPIDHGDGGVDLTVLRPRRSAATSSTSPPSHTLHPRQVDDVGDATARGTRSPETACPVTLIVISSASPARHRQRCGPTRSQPTQAGQGPQAARPSSTRRTIQARPVRVPSSSAITPGSTAIAQRPADGVRGLQAGCTAPWPPPRRTRRPATPRGGPVGRPGPRATAR